MSMNHISLTEAFREAVREDHERIKLVAGEWVQKGYHTYSIWGDELLFCWPPAARDELERLGDMEGTLSVSIKYREQVMGKMVLTGGEKTSLAQASLNAQASIVSSYLMMKTNFEQATLELVAQARLKAEIDVATRIQRRLLPEKPPLVYGLDMYACSRAAQQVGGDFYDFFFSENRLVFIVGDISGKGLPAALFMLMARIVLRTAAHAHATCSPRDIFVCANENLYSDFSDAGLLATIFIGCYDSNRRQITYTNSAQFPIISVPKNGHAYCLEADAVPLGVYPTITSLNHTLPFDAGDLLVIGTDGLSKSLNLHGEIFGNERLLNLVDALAHLPANQLGNELLEAITLFAVGASQEDDQTLVVIKGVRS